MKSNVPYLIVLLFFICFISCSDDEKIAEEKVTNQTLTWNIDGTKYSVNQESIEAKMTYSMFANVNHLAIIGRAETGEVLTLYIQELFPGGDGSCLSIERYPSEIIDEDCHDDGFLIICDHGACEYQTNDGVPFKSIDEVGGFVNISSCDNQTNTISGDFELNIEETGNANVEILISGTFIDLIYEIN